MTDYKLTPEQLVAIETAFKALKSETQQTFVWSLNPFETDSLAQPTEIEIDGIYHYPTSDRAMAILEKKGIEYKLLNNPKGDGKFDIRLSYGEPIKGTSPLQVLLLALKEIVG